MARKTFSNKILRTARPAGFQPDAYFSRMLHGLYAIGGLAIYRVLNDSAGRQRLLRLADRVEGAWRAGERTGRWSAFGRAVDRLKWLWLELLDLGGEGE